MEEGQNCLKDGDFVYIKFMNMDPSIYLGISTKFNVDLT